MMTQPAPTRPIGYILKMYPRFSETFILNEILELERQGVCLQIFSLKKPDDGRFHADIARVQAPVTYLPGSLLFAARTFFSAHRRVFRWNRRRYLRALALMLKRRSWRAFKRFGQAGYLLPQLRQAGIEHVHAHFASSAASVAYYLAELGGPTYSFTAHAKDIFSDDVVEDVLIRKLRAARFTVTISDFNQSHLQPLAGATPVYRIYNGLDLQRFTPNGVHPEEPPLILAVGRLVEKKGFDDLVRACALLRDAGRPFRCRIVGKGQEEAKLRALIDDLGLSAMVELVGPLPREDLIHLYPRASLVVAPCVIGEDGNRDGLPTVLIEAMAVGVPVISTDVTAIPELVKNGQTGLLVSQHDPIGLADAISSALDDPEQSRIWAANARPRIVEQFDIVANVTQLKGLFSQVVDPPKSLAGAEGQ
jgi:glycosyltransferase involved in cell wall biosynthesis